MSLDIDLTEYKKVSVYSDNITHNLTEMAEEAGLYEPIWRPLDHGIYRGADLIPILKEGLKILRKDPERFRKLNPPNHWGVYENFVIFVEQYLKACELHPNASIEVSR